MKKQQYSWRLVAEVKGEDLSLGTFWTDEEAAKHFDAGYEWQNDPSSRGGNVSINSEVYKCRKYISDSGDSGEDDEDASGAPSRVASDVEEEAAPQPPKGRGRKAAAAPEAAPALEVATKKRRNARSDPSARAVPSCAFRVALIHVHVSACIRTLCRSI